jgi:hypothetical protein
MHETCWSTAVWRREMSHDRSSSRDCVRKTPIKAATTGMVDAHDDELMRACLGQEMVSVTGVREVIRLFLIPSNHFFRRFVKNARMSRTEIMPTNFPSCVTSRCRIRLWAIRSLASSTVLSPSIVMIGRRNLFNCCREDIDVSRDHVSYHIGIRQDADDIVSIRYKQAVDVAIPHKPSRRLHIGISCNRNKLLTRPAPLYVSACSLKK